MSDLAEENPSIKEINVGELLNNLFIQRQIDTGFVDQLYSLGDTSCFLLHRHLLRILRYESKDTTYKFALLRGLIEI